MEKRVYANKPTLIIILIVSIIASIASFGYSFKTRIADAKASEDYDKVKAEIMDVHKIANSTDDGTRYSYELYLTFTTKEDEQYSYWTDDIFHYEPDIGDKVEVMVLPDSDGEFYVARYDWLSKCYLPYEKQYDTFIFLGAFLLAFALIMVGCLLQGQKASFIVIGIALVIVGIGGIFFAATSAGAPAYLIALFGVVGVLMIVKAIRLNPEEEARKKAEREAMLRQVNPYYPGEVNSGINVTQMPNYYQPTDTANQQYYQPTDTTDQQYYQPDSNQSNFN